MQNGDITVAVTVNIAEQSELKVGTVHPWLVYGDRLMLLFVCISVVCVHSFNDASCLCVFFWHKCCYCARLCFLFVFVSVWEEQLAGCCCCVRVLVCVCQTLSRSWLAVRFSACYVSVWTKIRRAGSVLLPTICDFQGFPSLVAAFCVFSVIVL